MSHGKEKAAGVVLQAGISILLLITMTACGKKDVPAVEVGVGSQTWIDAPLDGSRLPQAPYEIVFHSSDMAGIVQAECSLNSLSVQFDGSGQPSDSIQTFRHVWNPEKPGEYLIVCRGQNSNGDWSPGAQARVTIEGEAVDELLVQETTVTAAVESPTPSPTVAVVCAYDVDYLADVTIPEGTVMQPGQSFQKTWRFANAGNCPIDGAFEFAYFGAEQMGGPWQISSPDVAPGEEFELTLQFTAPAAPGQHESVYRFRTPDGEWFGSRPFVRIVVDGPPPVTETPEPTCTLNAPFPYYPANGYESLSQSVTLSWSYGLSGCTPDGYRVRYSTYSDFSSNVIKADVTGLSYSGSFSTCYGYFWQVRAMYGGEPGPWSTVSDFTIWCPPR